MPRPPEPPSVRHSGRDYPVLGTEHVRGRTYLLLEQLGRSDRPRYRAFDPHAGPRGEMRRLTVLPKQPAGDQHLRVLFRSRRTNDALSAVYAWEERRDQFVLVTEWADGTDLRSYLGRIAAGSLPPVSPHQAVRLVRGLAHGLDWLHDRGRVVHADVKPANLIVSRHARRLVLVDYGSAWPVETTTRRQIGDGHTAAYSAPELQGATGVIDGRVDQFSASVVLYELLTGRLPYEWGGKAGKPEYAAAMRGRYQPPSRLAPGRDRLPPEVWAAIDHAVTTGVAFEPNRRFRSDGDWLTALERAWRAVDPLPETAAGGPDAAPRGLLTRLRDALRRRPG
jgi:serine/threonine-protein kinase